MILLNLISSIEKEMFNLHCLIVFEYATPILNISQAKEDFKGIKMNPFCTTAISQIIVNSPCYFFPLAIFEQIVPNLPGTYTTADCGPSFPQFLSCSPEGSSRVQVVVHTVFLSDAMINQTAEWFLMWVDLSGDSTFLHTVSTVVP